MSQSNVSRYLRYLEIRSPPLSQERRKKKGERKETINCKNIYWYCGKPEMPPRRGVFRDCACCREKKLRCDHTYPSCKRCTSRGLRCPGVLEQRAMGSNGYELHPAQTDALSTLRTMRQSKETVLTTLFLGQIAICPHGAGRIANFSRNGRGIYSKTIAAIAQHLLAYRRNDAALMEMARVDYGEALMGLNAALRDNDRMLEDETLITVLNIQMHSKATDTGNHALVPHLLGSLHLLEKRLQTGKGSAALTADIIDWVLPQCMTQLLDNYREASALAESPAIWNGNALPAAQILQECANVGELRLHFSSIMTKPSAHQLWDTIRMAQDIDERLEQWFLSRPTWAQLRSSEVCNYSTCPLTRQFSDLRVSQVYNYARMARLWLHKIIHQAASGVIALAPPEEETRAEAMDLAEKSALMATTMLTQYNQTIAACRKELCATSVPAEGESHRVIAARALLWPELGLHWGQNIRVPGNIS